MLSDVSISFGGQAITFPALYLLIGCLIVLGLAGFIVAISSARRIERKTSEVTDILVVQLERIGDALDRIVSQNAARAANEPSSRQRDRFLPEWPVAARSAAPPPGRVAPEGSPLERAAQKPLEQPQIAASQTVPAPQENKTAEDQPIESTLSEPARSILFSMLGR
jgi:hypothetical protein